MVGVTTVSRMALAGGREGGMEGVYKVEREGALHLWGKGEGRSSELRRG